MNADPITGNTVRWTYRDGPMAGKAFEHTFGADGTVTWRTAGAQRSPSELAARYWVERVGDDVYAVSYLSSSGYTLTSVLDLRTRTLVSFASNEKELVIQHGTFEIAT